MINSTSSSDRVLRPDTVSTQAAKTPALRLGADRFSASNTDALRQTVASMPSIRPEVVARGRELAANPDYPSKDILRQVGAAILQAQDLTTEET